MRRRRATPTLPIGALALIVTAVALVIAFQAQNGLPLQSTYRVHADVPDAAKLSKNADVRIGGARVGQVLGIHAEPGRPPYARLDLALNPEVGPLPADTTTEVRLASVLGGKFLDLVPGTSRPGVPTIPDGGTIPLRNGRASVDTDQALQVFGPRSRGHIRAFVAGLAGGLAGRGAALNAALGATAAALPHAERALRVLLSPRTDLPGFVTGVADAASAIAPVAPALGRVVDRAGRAFGAIDAAGGALDEALAAAPGAERAATGALRTLRPVLDDAAAIATSLRPAAGVLPSALARVDASVRAARPVAGAVGRVAPGIDAALRAFDRFAADPAALAAIRALKGRDLATFGGSAFIGLGAILKTVAAGQLHCNVAALWMRNLASVASEGDAGGDWLRMIPIFEQSQAQSQHNAQPDPDLHVNYYPHENAHECEAGNEPYAPGQAIGNPPGDQSTKTETTGPNG